MDNYKKYAAIDVGSNAVRLLLARVIKDEFGTHQKKISWVRMPIRLGEDAFLTGQISDQKARQFEKTICGFKYLIEAFNPLAVMACATAAMRSAQNGPDICAKVHDKTGIDIQIIDGKQEADIIFKNKAFSSLNSSTASLLIDVGGGSTEMTLFYQGQIMASRSFNLGTVRLLNNMFKKSVWEEMRSWIKEHTEGYLSIEAIGSGGNISKLFRLTNGKTGKPVSYKKLNQMRKVLKKMTLDERIRRLNMRPDRADVIVPGSKIYLSAMKWAGCEVMHVPMLGLADGMVRVLHEQNAGL